MSTVYSLKGYNCWCILQWEHQGYLKDSSGSKRKCEFVPALYDSTDCLDCSGDGLERGSKVKGTKGNRMLPQLHCAVASWLAHTWALYKIRAQNQLNNPLLLLFLSDQSSCWKRSALIDWSQLESKSFMWVTGLREFRLWKAKKYDMFARRFSFRRWSWSRMENHNSRSHLSETSTFQSPTCLRSVWVYCSPTAASISLGYPLQWIFLGLFV